MANYLYDNYPAVTKKKDWATPSEEVVTPNTVNQLGNFLAQKVATAQPVKVEANPELMQAIPRTTVPEVGAEPAITQAPITPVEPTGSPVAQPQSFEQPSVSTVLPPRELSEHEKYWGNKVFGKIPLDQFVQMAGMLANSFNPEDPLGKQLAQMGGEAYKERMKREYEGPNKLLESMLTREKIGERVAGGAMRNALSNFVENWPDEAKRLKGLGYTDEAVNRMRQRRVNEIVTAYGGVKGAQLEEKTIGREEGIDVRKSGQAIQRRVADARITKMGGDAARAERGLNLREKKAREADGGKGKPGKLTPDQQWKTVGYTTDAAGNKLALQENKLGDLRTTPLPESVAVPPEKIPTRKTSRPGDEVKIMLDERIKLSRLNKTRKAQGLPPLTELPQETKPAVLAAKPAVVKVQTATNPKTGEKLKLVNGQWVPMKKGEQ